MTDVHTQEQRSYNMSRIRPSDTKPEVLLRRALWAKGLRYRIKSNLPGKPDVVLPKYKAVIFVDGCFWHQCPQHYVAPKTRAEFWEQKISGNVARDTKINGRLAEMGWSVIRIWEHEIKKSIEDSVEKCLHRLKLTDAGS